MPATKTARDQYGALEEQLSLEREKLRTRFAEQRTDVFIDREPDDEGAEANRNLTTHLILSTLDRERRILHEIELALERMKTGVYGVCDACGTSIPPARLRAVPWARYCVNCAERAATSEV
jgi:DnaK suppressor protein